MFPKDTIVSRELRLRDCLYSVSRQYDANTKIVYVLAESWSVIPNIESSREEDVLNIFSTLPEWPHDSWTTLNVYRAGDEVKAKPDVFEPHHLDQRMLLGDYPLFNYLDLPVLETYQTRVFRVLLNDQRCFLKLALFPKDVRPIVKELRAYHVLTELLSNTAPKLLGYACEGTADRVVGFFYEELVGRYPNFRDMQTCERSLDRLHELGICHGDIDRYNIVVTNNGRRAKFIDFEQSMVGPAGCDNEDFEERKDEESVELLGEVMNEHDNATGPRVVENKGFLAGLRISL